ncbi:MAG: tetratricopeptide repeat protein [Saprospiraceae bacterium]|nr:tetratricopeptide repeat protein [Saprospiraceae bacterium]
MKNILYVLLFLATTARAQNPGAVPPLDGRQYGVVLEHPGMKSVIVKSDISYLNNDKGNLHMDVYLPPGLKKQEKRPAIVFLNAVGDQEGESKLKSWGIYTSWPRLMAANGYIGISMESDGDRIQESLRGIFDFLAKNAGQFNIDPEKMGVYAASANVGQSVAYLMGEHANKGIRAAVLYYGHHQAGPYRKDLPVLSVIAEGDLHRSPGTADNLWKNVLANYAPWTIKMASGLPHAFDAFSDNDAARRIVMETISFWKNNLDPVPVPSWKPAEGRDLLGTVGIDRAKALGMLDQMTKKYPEDITVLAYYANELSADGQLAAAESVYLKMLKISPGDVHAMMDLIALLYKQKKTEEAEKWLATAFSSTRPSADAYNNLAYNLLVLGEDAEAAKCYEKAISIKPEGLTYYNLACAYSKSKNPDKAFAALEKAIEHGFTYRNQFEHDPDLEPLKSDSRFQVLLAKTK